MAGQYFTDPRPFYFLSGDEKLSFLDDCFTPGKKESNKFVENDRKKEPEKAKGKEGDKEKEKVEAEKKKVEEKSKIQTIELNVNICCDSCERKVREALEDVQGVEKVDCDQMNRKVFVKGSVKPEVVLKKVKKVKSDAKLVEKKK